MPKLKEMMAVLEQLAPTYLAEKWDNVGLMVGDPEWHINKVLCALDVSEAVINEAIQLNVNCIVSHHPFIFKPMAMLDLSLDKGKMIKKLIENHIAVYSMHTNYDIAWGGLNDYLAEGLGLEQVQVLQKTYEEPFYKVIVYVPITHQEQVREAIVKAGYSQIGNYKGCTFMNEGEGTFIPLDGSAPYIGEVGQFSRVKESALSFMVLKSEIKQAINVIKSMHPYEEIAYDIFELENMKKPYGMGRYGQLNEPMQLGTLLDKIKKFFNVSYVRVSTEDFTQSIQSVAICSGSGSDLIQKASQVAELYITGDVKFHEAQIAQANQLILVDVGHYASENRALSPIGNRVQVAFPDCEVAYSKMNGETLFIK